MEIKSNGNALRDWERVMRMQELLDEARRRSLVKKAGDRADSGDEGGNQAGHHPVR